MMLADGVEHFGLRFLDEAGEWVEEWDSSQLLDSSELPLGVEIELALRSTDPRTGEPQTSPVYRRRVMLPLRPLDLQTLLDPEAYAAAGGEEGEGDEPCQLTVADCVDLSQLGDSGQQGKGNLSALLALSPEERQAVRQLNRADLGAACWDDFRAAYGNHPAVRPHCR